MMATMLLPGTVILYYGDEIGMSDPAQPISCLETEDPYALPPYSGEVVCLGSPPRSRDPARTPMQVGDTMSWNVVVVVAAAVAASVVLLLLLLLLLLMLLLLMMMLVFIDSLFLLKWSSSKCS